MTITLELTPKQQAKLEQQAHAAGVEPAEYLIRMIDGEPSEKGTGETLLDALKRVGYVGSFKSVSREDGRPWSEVEGFE